MACDTIEPDENLEQERLESIHLDYEGIVQLEWGQAASFNLVNDSTETIQYFAYSEDSPLYNAEVLADTGWTILWWGWCGTGAEYFDLEPGSEVAFYSMLPPTSTTWRLLLSVADPGEENYQWIRSENIHYTVPQD